MKIFVVIVTYNGLKWYKRCLSSVENSDIPVHTVVVDNASTDNTTDYLEENFPQIHLIKSKDNLGFAKGNNVGINFALENNANFIFLLNQDAWVETNTISSLINAMHLNDKAGIISPMHLSGSGNNLDVNFTMYLTSKFISDSFLKKLENFYNLRFVNAAAWMLNVDCIERVGGFDTSLFSHYGEDDNYCQRVIYHGYDIILDTKSFIYHDREKREIQQPTVSLWNEANRNLSIKVKYGDVNEDVDLNKQILICYKKVIKNILFMKITHLKGVFEDIRTFKSIKISREKNKLGGLVWLK